MSHESFRVDLRGIVEILSHHLYSSPQVYLRELIQNARDAVVARREFDAGGSDTIAIEVDAAAGVVRVRDEGVGLTEDEMRSVLATIGASSKRGEFLEARRQFIGQFGIGLLSCFLVADEIEVLSRSAREPDAPTLRWVGHASGTFTVAPADDALPAPGTVVVLRARPDDREWVDPEHVRMLVERFAEHLEAPVTVRVDAGAAEVASARIPPWRQDEAAAMRWCRRTLGFTPLAVLPVSVPVAGVHGVAFIADTPGRVGNRRDDTLYSRGMFVSGDNTQLVPGWAYFARLAAESGDLALTASRESLQDSSTLALVQEQIGVQIRDGIERIARTDPDAFREFLAVHAKGLLAMAASDTDMLDLVVAHVPWETNEGDVTLATALRARDTVWFATSMTDFTTFASILRARGELLINGAYVYGAEILRLVRERSGRGTHGARLRRFDAEAFVRELAEPADDDVVAREVALLAAPVLRRWGVTAVVREYRPDAVPALYVDDPRPALDPSTRDDDPWAELLPQAAEPDDGPQLVLNVASSAVRALARLDAGPLRDDAVQGLYVIGMLTAGRKLEAEHAEVLNVTLRALIEAAVPAPDPGQRS